MATLTACLGGGDEPVTPPAQDPLPQTVLSCTETCAQQGQCGTADDGRLLVLGHTDGPHTRDHNLAFPVDTPIVIQGTVDQKIQPANAEAAMQTFSSIALADNSKTGWVANWCIPQPVTP